MQAKIYTVYIHEAPTIYETGARLSLDPWGGNNTDYKGEDDGGVLYELPEGFTVAESDGEKAILDANGGICTFWNLSNEDRVTFATEDKPRLIDSDGNTHMLAEAE